MSEVTCKATNLDVRWYGETVVIIDDAELAIWDTGVGLNLVKPTSIYSSRKRASLHTPAWLELELELELEQARIWPGSSALTLGLPAEVTNELH